MQFKNIHWNFNFFYDCLKHLVMNQIFALDNPQGVDMTLNRSTKLNLSQNSNDDDVTDRRRNYQMHSNVTQLKFK